MVLTREFHTPDFFELSKPCLSAENGVVSFAMNAQEHLFDEQSMMETLPVQKVLIEAVRQEFPHFRISAGPITLRPRGEYDRRAASPFGAAWTLGSLAMTVTSGATRLVYAEPPAGSPTERLFEVVRSFAGGFVCSCEVSEGRVVAALALANDSCRQLVLANLTDESVTVRLRETKIPIEPYSCAYVP